MSFIFCTQFLHFCLLQPMKCGYYGWHINELIETNVLQHRCFKIFDEEMHLLYVDDNNIVTMSKVSLNNK